MRKLSAFFAILFTFVLLLTACGGGDSGSASSEGEASSGGNSEEATSGETQVIKFAAINNSSHPAVVAINEKFKTMVEENSDGQLKVEVYDNAQLGGERDIIEQIQLGQVQMAYVSPVLGSIYEPVNLLDLPYLFKDHAHVDSVLEGELGQEIIEGLPEVGLRGFSYMENGFRQITNSVKEINSLADLKGLKIRVPEAPISVANLSALGANVVTMGFDELYSALQQGVVDGQENAYPTLSEKTLWEVQEYVAETNHMWGSFIVLGSEDWFQGLSEEHQAIVQEAAEEAAIYQKELFRESEAVDKQTLIDNGMTITTPDLAEFQEAANSVYEDFYSENPDLKDLIEEIRNNGN